MQTKGHSKDIYIHVSLSPNQASNICDLKINSSYSTIISKVFCVNFENKSTRCQEIIWKKNSKSSFMLLMTFLNKVRRANL